MEKLDFLRNEIDRLDKSLLNILAKRLLLVSQIGELKSRFGLSVHAPDREEMMFSSRRKEAEELGISPDLIEDILRRVIRESYFNENEKGFKNLCPYLRPVIIISNDAGMGKLFNRMFILSGYQVRFLEKEDLYLEEKNLQSACLVLIIASISFTKIVISKLPKLMNDCILVNVSSIKDHALLEIMLGFHRGPVLTLHPMFPSDIQNMIKQAIIYYKGRMSEMCQWLLDQIRVWGVKLYSWDVIKHDKNIFSIQSFLYFIFFVFGLHLKDEDVDLKQILLLSCSMFRVELAMAGRFFAKDSQFYIDDIINSKNNLLMIKSYYQRVGEILFLLENNKMQDLNDCFDKIKCWFGGYTKLFLKESQILLKYIDDFKE
ncbi:bifunctional chorismate mutase/prephenate dehydrogenase [Blochmannia endosymbiont of Colobopsis nipponica]|uniref:bifunctional chorismate mutase/prephenate dehydrogenase n=1 Tax=Blochmannia endosymbiont of Colobopsis nipponica TaxID=2681987 RepID=UPI001CE238A7|nr:bifunctional chorismate mutase/prephenate dehydrogenase [Blochmannia endosymbiont of Colobopsis nipponica]